MLRFETSCRGAQPRRRRAARRLRQHGYALLGLITALIVLAITMTVALPNVRTQARRQLELEMMHRGEHMAEAIARYYSQGRLGPAGLVVKTPPPPQGFLLDLKKLRDGVTIGVNEVYFCRVSAFIDPLTDGEWEPIRIGDPRLRKFFRAWQQATGRQVPPIYATYMGGPSVDTSQQPDVDGEDGEEDEELDTGEDIEDDEGEDEDDEEFDEDEDEEEDDEGDDEDLQRSSLAPGSASFVRAAYQLPAVQSNTNQAPGTGPVVRRPQTNSNSGWVFGDGSKRLTPIIGVVSKAKGKSVRSRFGIDRYEEMIFIYLPPQFGVVPGQAQPQQPNPNQSGGGITDANGDGIDDSIKPNTNANTNQSPRN